MCGSKIHHMHADIENPLVLFKCTAPHLQSLCCDLLTTGVGAIPVDVLWEADFARALHLWMLFGGEYSLVG